MRGLLTRSKGSVRDILEELKGILKNKIFVTKLTTQYLSM